MGILQKIRREYTTIKAFLGLHKWTSKLGPDQTNTLADDLEAVVNKYRANVAIRYEDKVITYGELDQTANQVAHWAHCQGLQAGDAVALFMENRPEYIAVWYGLQKIGVIVGLINHNLTDQALAHCINVSAARLVVTGADQDIAIQTARDHIEGTLPIWTLGGKEGEDLSAALTDQSTDRPDPMHRAGLRGRDVALYIYTSGTTGLPKAARITQARLAGMMRSFIAPCEVTARDRVYVSLPLYHSTGGICGVGVALLTGACLVLRQKFSASSFWDDCVDYQVSVIVYIGELCRYLTNQPAHPRETAHTVRTGFGNGLRPDIWEQFQSRFGIPKLVEFYGSTEGNVSFANVDGKVGAVGRIPSYLKRSFEHVAFVRFDMVEQQPERGPDGFCIRVDTDEPGEAIGRLGTETNTRFEGYKDPAATQKKILRDVFEPGDQWFRTGDLMKKDAEGYIYFVDRVGDTFRWKGENVSTNEVSEVLSQAPAVATANVYGVEVPGADGRAGMAAITVKGEVDFDTLFDWMSQRLPKYAIPLFIRVQREAETTGTFKYRKVELVEEGFNAEEINDPIWYLEPRLNKYVVLTSEAYADLRAGAVRF